VILKQKETTYIVVGEIDIDSDEEDAFTKKDALFLENIADMLGPHIHKL